MTAPPAPPTVSSKPPPERFIGLDAARFFAAVGVVWLHVLGATPVYSVLGRFGVPFFAAAAVFLTTSSLLQKPNRSAGEYFWSRFKRLYVPFLAWTLIYAVVRIAKARIIMREESKLTVDASILWDGTSLHLWFLPFIFAVLCLLFPVGVAMGRSRGIAWGVAILAAVGGGVLAATQTIGTWAPLPIAETTSVHAAWYTVSATLWGITLAVVWRSVSDSVRRGWLVPAIAVVVFIASNALLLRHDRVAWLENVAGFSLVIAALGPWRGRLIEAMAWLGGLSYGIYLVHAVIYQGIQTVGTKRGYPPGSSLAFEIGTVVVTVIIAVAVCWVLRRFKVTAWLVP